MKINKLLDSLSYTFMTALLMIYIVTGSIISIFEFNVSSFVLLLFIISEAVIVKVIIQFRKKLIMYLSLVAAIILVIFLLYRFNISVTDYLGKFFNWIFVDYMDREEAYESFYVVLMLFITVITSVIAFMLQKKFITRFAVALLIGAGTIAMAVLNIGISKLQIICTVAYIFFVIVERAFIQNEQDNNKRAQKISQRLIPFVVVFGLCVSIFPSQQTSFQWGFVKKAYKSMYIKINNTINDFKVNYMGKDDYYSLKMVSYSKSGNLGGDLAVTSNDRALNIETDFEPTKALYITGSIMNNYQKNKWTSDRNKSTKIMESALDSDELIYAINRSGDKVDSTKLFDIRKITISYDGIHTKTMFFPIKTNFITSTDKYKAVGDELHYNKSMGYPTSYSVDYYDVRYSNSEFAKLVHDQAGYKYDVNNNGKYSYSRKLLVLKDDPEGVLKERRNDIYSSYTDVPDCISDRVKELAKTLTANCNNDYNKLKAIEYYLSSKYTYTTTPGKIPKGKELVDYFLFESQKGYCTYYATSMAILARCAGIPTRYVQGFMCEADYSAYSYKAKNSSAHAWVEGYIEGIGWVPFEPTSSFTDKRYPRNDQASVESEESEDEHNPDIDNKKINEIMNGGKKNNSDIMATIIIICVAIVVLLMIFIIASYFVVMKRFRKKYSRGSNNEKYMQMFMYMVKLLELNGYSPYEAETIRQFALRISKEYNTKEMDIQKIGKDFMKIRYGGHKITDKQLEYISSFCDTLVKERIELKGKFRFSIKDYFIKNRLLK